MLKRTVQASKQAAAALDQARSDLANQRALNQSLSQLQNSRNSIAQAGQSVSSALKTKMVRDRDKVRVKDKDKVRGKVRGKDRVKGKVSKRAAVVEPMPTHCPLPTVQARPATRKAQGKTVVSANAGNQVYVPRNKVNGSNGDPLFIPGQDTNQGETQTKEQRDPLGGVNNPALVPYDEVYQSYRDAANQAVDQSYVPAGLKDYIREYFSQLEP